MRYEVDNHQSHERLVWWTGGGTHVPEVTGSILAAVIIPRFPQPVCAVSCVDLPTFILFLPKRPFGSNTQREFKFSERGGC